MIGQPDNEPDPVNLRQFYRDSGLVYLNVYSDNETPLENIEPEELDSVAIKLMNLKHQLTYHNPEYSEPVQELVKIVEDLYQNCLKPDAKRFPKFKKQAVVISGSGMDFLSERGYAVDDEVVCQIAFPGYPYILVDVAAQVVRSDHLAGHKRYKVSVKFVRISEKTQDQIVQFVNSLSRQKRTKDLK